jgi:hypothetical protein
MHSEKKFEHVNQTVKTNLLEFFKNSNPPKKLKDRKNWIEISKALNMLNQQVSKNEI